MAAPIVERFARFRPIIKMTSTQVLNHRLVSPVKSAGFSADSTSVWTVHDDLIARRRDICRGFEEAHLNPWRTPESSAYVSPEWRWDEARARSILSACGRYYLAMLPAIDHPGVFSRVFDLRSHALLTVNYGPCRFMDASGVLLKSHNNTVPSGTDLARLEPSGLGHLYDFQKGYLYPLDFLPQGHAQLCLSPDLQHAASWKGWREHNVEVPHRANEVSVWDVADQRRVSRLEYSATQTPGGHQDAISAAVFLPGKSPRLLTASKQESWGVANDNCNGLVWDFENGEPLFALEADKRAALLPTVTPDGSRILVVTERNTLREPFVRCLDATNGRELFRTESHDGGSLQSQECGVDQIAVSPDSLYLASLCARSGEVHITDLVRGCLTDTVVVDGIEQDADDSGLIRFSPDSSKLLVSCRSDQISVFELEG